MRKFLLAGAVLVTAIFSAQTQYSKAPMANITATPSSHYLKTAKAFPTTEWSALADTSWYNASATQFTISTAEQFAGLAQLVIGGNNFQGKSFVLSADLDLGAHLWTPVGQNVAKPFSGNFDGQNHTIKNVLVNRDTSDFSGLFGQFYGGTLKNLNIDTAEVRGRDTVGAMVGQLSTNATMINCHAKNVNITAVRGEPLSSGYNAGGLLGASISNSTITDCSAKGVVTGFAQIGGFIGSPWDKVTIKRSFFEGVVNGDNLAGGFGGFSTFAFGPNREVVVEDCYAKVSMFGDDKLGGFYGYIQAGIIKNSYAVADVTPNANSAGAFIGATSGGQFTNVFFNSTVTTLPGVGLYEGPQNFTALAKTTTEMKSQTFADLLNTGSATPAWYLYANVNDGYPAFQFQQLATASAVKVQAVSIYPSLVADKINIVSKTPFASYNIFDASGRKVSGGQLSGTEIMVNQLKSGKYILMLQNTNGNASQSFIKK